MSEGIPAIKRVFSGAFGLIQNRRKRSRRNLNSLPSRSLKHKFRRGKESSVTARFVERRPPWAGGWGAFRRDTANTKDKTAIHYSVRVCMEIPGKGAALCPSPEGEFRAAKGFFGSFFAREKRTIEAQGEICVRAYCNAAHGLQSPNALRLSQ